MPFNPAEYYKEYRKKNKYRLLKTQRKWQKENPDKVKDATARYREKHREAIRIRQKEFYHNNTERCKEYKKKYKAKLKRSKNVASRNR